MCSSSSPVPPPPGAVAVHPSEADALLARLDDPGTATALHTLLDHAELLALLVQMLDGLLRRSETLTSNLAEGLADVRTAVGGTGSGPDVGALLAALPAALPALQALLASRLAQPATISALDTLSGAVVDGLAEAPARKPGVRSLLAELRDPETARGLSALLGVARALGRAGA